LFRISFGVSPSASCRPKYSEATYSDFIELSSL